MAAPTPVSSLVHSSTLVVAGCVLCVKLGDCMRVMWVNGLLVVVGLLTSLFDYIAGCYGDVNIIEGYMFAGQEVRLISCVGCGVGFVLGRVVLCLVVMCGLTFTSCYYSKEYSEDTLLHVINVVMFMSVMYSLRVIYVLMGGLSSKVLIIPILVMGWFLIINFSMPCNPGFDVWVFPWVINVDLYYEYLSSGVIGLKFFVLSFVKGLHVSGFMPLIGLLNVKRRFEESKILEGDVVWCVFYAVVVIFGFTVNNWLSMWTVLELTTWVAVVIVIEEMNSSELGLPPVHWWMGWVLKSVSWRVSDRGYYDVMIVSLYASGFVGGWWVLKDHGYWKIAIKVGAKVENISKFKRFVLLEMLVEFCGLNGFVDCCFRVLRWFCGWLVGLEGVILQEKEPII
ncbi:NADH-ubiquinone oxidoreductase chain -like protein [Trichinella pseudospiralis]|uniref:NADH-ubiquinone oxidoreductase chain-like protein n=1 Tax=Trichinella pseudospiralis TaxID=6337 RepID=A0A0V1F6B6_TRIPS|nr:NADH-ubiquinone oxidoreductase chain -like protein [Trichinella pseudospiralis]